MDQLLSRMDSNLNKGDMMHGGRVKVERCSKGIIVLTAIHPDGMELGVSLSLVEAGILVTALNTELARQLKRFNPKPPGRKAVKHIWNNKALTRKEWCAEMGISLQSLNYHITQQGSVSKALEHWSKLHKSNGHVGVECEKNDGGA